MKKKIIIILSTIIGLFLIIGIIFFTYTGIYYHADSTAYDYLKSSGEVEVTENNKYISFVKTNSNNENAIIFYEGAKVEAKAYARILYTLALNDISCYAIKSPFRFAFFGSNEYKKIINSTSYQSYYLMGHSLGGVVAGGKLEDSNVSGVILLASYLNNDLSDTDKKALSIYGSNDKVLNLEKYNKAKKLLPKNSLEYVIEGGIHSYFADYGAQAHDGVASIEKTKMQDLVCKYIIDFIDGFNKMP